MDFKLTEEQQMLQDTAARLVRDAYPFEQREKFSESELGFSAEFWSQLGELGLTAVPFSEDIGGFGGSGVETMLVMTELGRGLTLEPYLQSVILAGGLINQLGSDAQKQDLLPQVAAGSLQLAVAFDELQSHYNLIMREDERELFGLCAEEGIAMTPYSALASGRLSRLEGHTRRAVEDDYARGKYDGTAEQDRIIIARVAELAERHQVSMTEISLAWLLTKVTAPVIGATQKHHVDGAVNAVALQLSPEDIRYLEEAYQPHFLTGVMAQNTPQAKDRPLVWTR